MERQLALSLVAGLLLLLMGGWEVAEEVKLAEPRSWRVWYYLLVWIMGVVTLLLTLSEVAG